MTSSFIYQTFIFIIDALITVSVALMIRSVMSLIWGIVEGVITEVVLSFIIFNVRPKLIFEADKAKKLLVEVSGLLLEESLNT